MTCRRLVVALAVLLLAEKATALAAANESSAAAAVPAAVQAPVAEGRWVRPAAATTTQPARPIWGHADGLRVELAHADRGPRGLLRIYAPYLQPATDRVINFIAVEPIVQGETHRGLSELESSTLDGVRGKRFWSVDDPTDRAPRPPDRPARGTIETIDGVEHLRVFVQVEPFDNGARVYLRMTFRADRPREVALAAYAHDDSKPLKHCILSATMGNYARLRNLHLADGLVSSLALWPDYRGDGFAPHAKFPLAKMARTPEGHAIAWATPNEPDPASATYAPGTRRHWRYSGIVATQSWRVESPDPALQLFVNGRYTYWSSRSAIPGGISFENFELVSPFRPGETFHFSVEPGAEPGLARTP